jgi:hypothetical protein
MSDDDEIITCATYTHARRHPMVLGHIGGWTPPFQLSLPQLGVVVVAIWFEAMTYRWWLAHLPRVLAVMLAVALPCVLAWAVRSARAEGRGLPRTALAYLTMAWMPREGHVGGRAYRHAKAARPGLARVYVESGEEAW